MYQMRFFIVPCVLLFPAKLRWTSIHRHNQPQTGQSNCINGASLTNNLDEREENRDEHGKSRNTKPYTINEVREFFKIFKPPLRTSIVFTCF